MDFNSDYYITDIKGSIDHPHFKKRADWIKEYIIGNKPKIYILGCGYGFTVKYLRLLGINAYGVELPYAYSQRIVDEIFSCDIKDADMSDADYIFSWNVLDCLNEESVKDVMNNLKKFTCTQVHVICTSDNYPKYFIKPVSYWKSFLPDAIFVDYCNRIGLEGMPLCWHLVSK